MRPWATPATGTFAGGGLQPKAPFVTQTYATPTLVSGSFFYPMDGKTTRLLQPLTSFNVLPSPVVAPVGIPIGPPIVVDGG